MIVPIVTITMAVRIACRAARSVVNRTVIVP
jgi:hypothetical protein